MGDFTDGISAAARKAGSGLGDDFELLRAALRVVGLESMAFTTCLTISVLVSEAVDKYGVEHPLTQALTRMLTASMEVSKAFWGMGKAQEN